MGNRIRIHLAPGFDQSLVPIPAIRHRDWWEDNSATKNHAKHCLPLSMANSLGFYLRSPGTFTVSWDGSPHKRAHIEHIEKSSHYEVDNHAAFGCFVVQMKFIPVTDDPGDFVYIKGIPNQRAVPYVCMEACIEAWWSVANAGLVFILNQPGEFTIHLGQPIAHMFLFHGVAGAAVGEVYDGYPEGHNHWQAKRTRKGYVKDLDYLRGFNSAGENIPTHLTNWKDAGKYEHGGNR